MATFTNIEGSVPAKDGDLIAFAEDLSGNENHATQGTVPRRPVLEVDPDGTAFMSHDGVDDALVVDLGNLGADCTVAYVTPWAVHFEQGVTIDGPAYTLPQVALSEIFVLDRATNGDETEQIIRRLASQVSGVNYGAVINRLTLIAINAVDVFVYDTSTDSDGGAWRTGALAQASSWYNETLNTATRGARREFPAVAVIVAEASDVTIYDGDDPALPIWMKFRRSGGVLAYSSLGEKSLFMLNGEMLVGTPSGLFRLNFLADLMRFHQGGGDRQQVGIESRGTIAMVDVGETDYIASSDTNDVAMTVLPDAPVDPATGLPVPAIAVATSGGVSVISDSGAVYDSVKTVVATDITLNGDTARVAFTDDVVAEYDLTSISAGGFVGAEINRISGTTTSLAENALGSSGGVWIADGVLRHRLASDFASGWMPGDIKGAWLADADATDLVGGELVTNGSFDADSDWTKGTGWTISGGVATHAAGAGSDITQPDILVGGKTYVLTLDVTAVRATSLLYVLAKSGAGNDYQTIEEVVTTGTKTVIFVAPATNALAIRLGGPADVDIDNVSVRLADADRSTNNNPLTLTGTITRSPVATGAELAAYSGFSAGVNELTLTAASIADTLYGLCWVQVGGAWELQHGVMSAAPIEGVSIAGTTLTVAGANAKALLRLTATTPTSAQLAKIEADEAALFQPNAACTLYGASDVVTALAHDPGTDLLHAGTSAGRSIFKGLERIGNTDTSVSAAISAASGLIVEK